jgi:hypothetical protein
MPSRFLRPTICNSTRFNACSFGAANLWLRILTLVDDFGRYDGRIQILHGHCFALRPDITQQDTAAFLAELQANRMVQVYTVDGREYVQLLEWNERKRVQKSKWPDPPADIPQQPAADVSEPQQSAADASEAQQMPAPIAFIPSTIACTPSPPPTPAVPLQGTGQREFSQLPSSERNRLILEAKKRTCELGTFRSASGRPKDHTRAWSRDAMDYLTQHLPVPEEEWKAVEWFHGLAPDDTIQELKNRRQSETTLWQFWSDEVTRANGYRRKVKGLAGGIANGSTAKKEPPLWREFFRSKYGPEVRLPARFGELQRDSQQEWEREHEEFEATIAAPPLKEPPRWQDVFRWKYGRDYVLPETFGELPCERQAEYERDYPTFCAAERQPVLTAA